MLRFALAAAALALASAGDQFCFDHAGTPKGRAITAGQSAAILPGRALNEIFPGGTRIVPQPSTLEENNGDGKVPPALNSQCLACSRPSTRTLHLTQRGASWASGAAQAAQFVRIILVWLRRLRGSRGGF